MIVLASFFGRVEIEFLHFPSGRWQCILLASVCVHYNGKFDNLFTNLSQDFSAAISA